MELRLTHRNSYTPALFAVSGIVTYYSFLRSHILRVFFVRRITRLYVPYLVLTLLAFGLNAILGGPSAPGIYAVFDWAMMNMRSANEPYHLGQVWFLRSLVVITILALPFYLLSRRSVHFLLIPVFVSLVLAVSQSLWNVGGLFWVRLDNFNSFNLYHPLVNFGYYMFGAWLFATDWHRSSRFGSVFLVVLMAVLLLIIQFADVDPDLGNHSYYQNIFYMTLGYLGIIGLFRFRPFFARIFSATPVGRVLQFFSVHAFIIYLVHSFFIQFSEDYFGWTNVAASPGLALAKIAFVISASCLSAIPLSWLTKKLTHEAIGFFKAA